MAMLIHLLLVGFLHLLVGRGRIQAQSCLQSNTSYGGDNLPYFEFGIPRSGGPTIGINPVQVIITSYQFECCGIIRGWGALVSVVNYRTTVYSMTYQVWRPSSTCGHYSKVGENYFSRLRYADNNQIGSPFIPEEERIQYQPGDVIGYFLVEESGRNDEGVQHNTSFSQESMWYAMNVTGEELQVGITGDLNMKTNLGPIIRPFTDTIQCPETEAPMNTDSIATQSPRCAIPQPGSTSGMNITQVNDTGVNNEVNNVGVIVGVLATVIIVVVPIFVLVGVCIMKRRQDMCDSKTAGEKTVPHTTSPTKNPTDQDSSNNRVHTKDNRAPPFTSQEYDYVLSSIPNHHISTSQNVAYGDISTSTTKEVNGYYSNEGLQDLKKF